MARAQLGEREQQRHDQTSPADHAQRAQWRCAGVQNAGQRHPANTIGMVPITIHTARRKYASLKSRRPGRRASRKQGAGHRSRSRSRRPPAPLAAWQPKMPSPDLPPEQRRNHAHMRRRGDRQELGNALNNAQHRDLGIAQGRESGVDPCVQTSAMVSSPLLQFVDDVVSGREGQKRARCCTRDVIDDKKRHLCVVTSCMGHSHL